MTTDERYAEQLRARVDEAIPPLDVAVDHVLPRARRRRRAMRGLGAATTLVVVLGSGWAVTEGLWLDGAAVQPAGPDVTDGAAKDGDITDGPVEDAAAVIVGGVPAEPVVAEDGTVTGVPGDPWDGDAPYWYMSIETVAGPDEPLEHLETWLSRERPGLLLLDGELERTVGVGPSDVIGELVLRGERRPVSDPDALPTAPDELEQALTGRPTADAATDDATFVTVRDTLHRAGLLPPALRDAYWQVAAGLPGVTASDGQDERGRPGQVLRRVMTDGEEVVLVRDPATGLLLQTWSSTGSWNVYLEQRVADATPVPPSREALACRDWASCAR